MENVPTVSNIPENKVKISGKPEGFKQMENSTDVLDEEELNLEEEKRIQSLIKPPYPRRRQRGRKADKEVILKPSLKSPSSKRSKTNSKLVIPKKLDILSSSGFTKHPVATPKQNLPTPQLTHPFLSDKTDSEAERLKSLNDDLVGKVTKVLENQNKEADISLKINAVTNCEDLQRSLSMDEVSEDKIERIVEVEDIQIIKPKRTFQRVRKTDRFKFHPSAVSEVNKLEKINLDVGVRQKESVVLCPLSSMMNSEVRDSEMVNVFKLGTGAGVKHMTV